MLPRPLRHALAAALALALSGCPTTEPPEEPTPDPADGVDPGVAAAEGEARAGRIRDGGEDALFGGIAAEGQAGDVMLYNRLVQFVVQGAYRSHGYIDTGGAIIDADLVRAGGQLGRDPIDDLFISHGVGWLFHADTVDVASPGGDGIAARVRATGSLVRWSFIEGAVEAEDPILPWVEIGVVVDYTLPPESHTVRIEATYTNVGRDDANINPALGWLASDEDLDGWAAGQGVDPDDLDGLAAVGAVGAAGEATYSFWPDHGELNSLGVAALVSSAGISATTAGWTLLAEGDAVSMVQNLTVAPDALTAEAARHDAQGTPLGTVSGVVSSGGEGVAGVRVWFVDPATDPAVIAGFAVTGTDGAYEGRVPVGTWDVYAVGRGSGEHVDLPASAGRYAPYASGPINGAQLDALSGAAAPPPLAFATGWPTPAPVSVGVVDGDHITADLELPPRGAIALTIEDDAGAPLPAYVEIHRTDGEDPAAAVPPELARHLGIVETGSRLARVWLPDGDLTIDLPPATYRLDVEHSWRHERVRIEDVAVAAGETATATATLAETLPHDGWLAVDSHLHAAPSNDGQLPMEHRVVACAATGVDLPVNTDHDRMVDYQPIVEALGLSGRMQFLPGVEVSPVLRGHFNLFPVEPDPALINGGAESWWGIPEDQDDLLARIRASGTEHSLVQVNHGRSGMFDFASYAPESGLAGDEDTWSWDFDVFELINGSGRGDFSELRADWFSFLNLGMGKVATGVSDSHGRGSPCGYGRTDIFVGSTDPASITPADVRAAFVAGHTVVAGGTTLRASADDGDALPGDVLTGGAHELSARVLAPSWLVPGPLRLIRNGEIVDEIAVAAEPADGLWLEHVFAIEDDTDAWYVLETEGAGGMGGVWRGGVPYAATNAFFVDVAGDGWDPPGLD